MKKHHIFKGIPGLLLACILVGSALSAYQSYQEYREEQEFEEAFWKLVTRFETIIGKQNALEPLDEDDQKRFWELDEEFHDWEEEFNEAASRVSSQLWADLFLSDHVQEDTKEYMASAVDSWSLEAEFLLPVLDSPDISDDIKYCLLARIQKTGSGDEKLRKYKLELLENAQDKEACYSRLLLLVTREGNTEKELRMDASEAMMQADHYLDHPEQYKDYQLMAAAIFKIAYEKEEELQQLSPERKEQLSRILQKECESEICEQEFYAQIPELLCYMHLDRGACLDWLLELGERCRADTSLAGWRSVKNLQYIFDEYLAEAFADVKQEPDLKKEERLLRMLDYVTTLHKDWKSEEPLDVITDYMGALLAENPDREQLPVLPEEETLEGYEGWLCTKDIDGDGLADTERFIAWDRAEHASYEIRFGNGDLLSYTYPAKVWNTYRMKYADVNGDENKEVILYIDMNMNTGEKYGVDYNELDADNENFYYELAEQAPKGLIVFTKQEGTKEYMPVRTKSGGVMVTDIFDKNGRLDYQKNWIEELEEF